MRPEWSTCSFCDAEREDIWWDPPIALQLQTAIAVPTAPSAYSATTTTATPGPTQASAVPETTVITSSTSQPVQDSNPPTATVASVLSHEISSSLGPQQSSGSSSGSPEPSRQPSVTQASFSDTPNQQETSQYPSNMIASVLGETTLQDPVTVDSSVLQDPSSASAETTNALSVLVQAQTEPSTGIQASDPSADPTLPSPADPDALPTAIAGSAPGSSSLQATQAVYTGLNNHLVTVKQEGSSAIIIVAGGAFTTLPPGAQATVNGKYVSIPSSAGNVVIGESTLTLPTANSAALNDPAVQVVATDLAGNLLTMAQQGSSVVIAGSGLTTTVPLSAQASLNGQAISVPSAGGAAVVGGSSIIFQPAILDTSVGSGSQAVVTGLAGNLITMVRQGSSAIIAGAGSSATVALGVQISFAGQTISIPSTGDAAIIGGSTVALSAVANGGSAAPEWQVVATGSDGEAFTLLQEGSSAVLADGTSTTTVAFGSHVIFAGETISLPSGGGAAMIDSSTILFTETPSRLDAVSMATASTETVFTDADGDRITVAQQGPSYLIDAAGSTTMIQAGATAVFDDLTLALPTSGLAVQVDGFPAASWAESSAAVEESAVVNGAGQLMTLVESGSMVVVEEQSSTATILAGSGMVVDGEKISKASGAVVVDVSTVLLFKATSGPATTVPIQYNGARWNIKISSCRPNRRDATVVDDQELGDERMWAVKSV